MGKKKQRKLTGKRKKEIESGSFFFHVGCYVFDTMLRTMVEYLELIKRLIGLYPL